MVLGGCVCVGGVRWGFADDGNNFKFKSDIRYRYFDFAEIRLFFHADFGNNHKNFSHEKLTLKFLTILYQIPLKFSNYTRWSTS